MNNILVTVSGGINTGKSTISQLIHNTLTEKGFIVTMNLENTPQHMEERIKALNTTVGVEIKEVCTKFSGRIKQSRYIEPIKEGIHLMTIKKWKEAIYSGMITDDDGHGYWVKDGMMSRYCPFSSDQEDATHVIWFNK